MMTLVQTSKLVLAVIDDREDLRGSVVQVLSESLPSEWELIESGPLDELEDYYEWLLDCHVCAMVVDEKLHERRNVAGKFVKYAGHDVARFLDTRLPGMPVYLLTAFPGDESLASFARFADVVVDRQSMGEHGFDWLVEQLLRRGETFARQRDTRFARLTELSRIAASGTSNEDQNRELLQLQSQLEASALPSHYLSQSEVFKSLEAKVEELEALALKVAVDKSARRTTRK